MRLADTLSPHGPVTRAVCEVDRGRVVRLDEVGGLARRGPSIVAGDGRVLDPDTLVSMNFWVLPAFVLERLAVAFSAFAARPDTAARVVSSAWDRRTSGLRNWTEVIGGQITGCGDRPTQTLFTRTAALPRTRGRETECAGVVPRPLLFHRDRRARIDRLPFAAPAPAA